MAALDPRTLPAGPNLSLGDNIAAAADNFALWLEAPLNLDQGAAEADSIAAMATTAPNAPAEVGQAFSDFGQSVSGAVGGLATSATNTATVLALWGGVFIVGAMLLQKAEAR